MSSMAYRQLPLPRNYIVELRWMVAFTPAPFGDSIQLPCPPQMQTLSSSLKACVFNVILDILVIELRIVLLVIVGRR